MKLIIYFYLRYGITTSRNSCSAAQDPAAMNGPWCRLLYQPPMAKAREAEKERQARIFVEQKKRREKEDAEHRRQVLEQLERDKAERMGKKYVPPEHEGLEIAPVVIGK